MICLVLVTSFCQAADTIKIATVLPETGKGGKEGTDYVEAARFTVREINQQGGLLGRQVELIEFDNKSMPLGSKLAAKKAVKAGVAGVIGAIWSSNSLAMAPVLQAAEIPMISPVSTNPDVTLVGDYIFRACFIDPFQGAVMAKFAIHDIGAKTAVVFVNANSKYSTGLAKVFVHWFRDLGGKILWEGDYLDEETDFSPLLKKVEMLKPDVIFVPGRLADSGLIISQARKTGLSATFLGGDGWGEKMYEYAKERLHGNYYSSHWHPEVHSQKSRDFVGKYQKKHGSVFVRHALSYDTVHLLADAIRRANSPAPNRIRDALAATKDFQGVTGKITLNQNGDPVKSAVVLKFDKGTIVYVKTVDP